MSKKNKIDKTQFEKLCAILCTQEEIAGFFDVSNSDISKWVQEEYGQSFGEVWNKKSSLGKISLRRFQFKQAEVNANMSIWLGKQYLGQKDNSGMMINGEKIEIINDVKKED